MIFFFSFLTGLCNGALIWIRHQLEEQKRNDSKPVR